MERRTFLVTPILLAAVSGTQWTRADVERWAAEAVKRAKIELGERGNWRNASAVSWQRTIEKRAVDLMDQIIPPPIIEKIQADVAAMYARGLTEDEVLAQLA